MKNEIKDVSLSFCCKEDWNSFATIDDRTRFCRACKNKVVDFTNASEAEFNALTNSSEKICGRFKQSQLSESFLKIAAASLVVAASASSIACDNTEAVAPQIPKQESCPITTGIIVLGVLPPPPDPLKIGSRFLPIVVGDTTSGQVPLRYNPAIPSKGFYKNKGLEAHY